MRPIDSDMTRQVRAGWLVLASVCVFAAQLTADAHGATFLVGTGAGCQFNTIQGGINAAASNPGVDVVRISNATTWGPGGVTVGSQDVTLDGRFANCTDTVANGNYAQLVGNAVNPSTRPAMISITGSGVRRLLGLQIRNNVRTGTSSGGAINYSGSGEVTLSEMDVRDNEADTGGAIAALSGTLTLSSEVLIESNTAYSGGGIHLSGSAVLFAVEAGTSIAGNEATNCGGGICMFGQSSAFIASSGLDGRAVLQSNLVGIDSNAGVNAGGAIAIFDSARAVLYSTNASSLPRIVGNRARESGGAIYVGSGSVCLLGVNLAGNRANRGAALLADSVGIGVARIFSNRSERAECAVPVNAPLPPADCSPNAAGCNVIEGHVTENVTGNPSQASVVFLANDAELHMSNVSFINNSSGDLIGTFNAARVDINTALIAANTFTSAALRLGFEDLNQGFVMRNVTIANNAIASSNPSVWLFDVPATIRFNNNLIFQPGRTPLLATFAIANSVTHNWEYNATNAPQVLPNPFQQILSDARFENTAFDDYRLRVGAASVNAFPAGPSVDATLDLDRRPRPADLSIFPLDISNDDVGAYERQESDPWLVNGGFSAATQMRYWEPSANGEAIPGVIWDAQDSVGNPDSGSALVNLPISLAPRLTVLRRCFNVPAPGVYTINAKARRGTGFNDDGAVLAWALRTNEPTCTSASVQGAGESAFSGGSGWSSLASPLQITIPSTTANTTIEIRLDVVSGLNLNGLTNVRFDDISVTGAPLVGDVIFSDGFED